MDKGVLVLGATSAIAREIAKVLASRGYSLYLASRDVEELDRIARDLVVRFGVEIEYGFYDIEDTSRNTAFLEKVLNKVHELQGVVFAVGMLGEPSASIREFSEAQKIIERNFTGACAILGEIANVLEKQKRGFLIGISSVAGDRGRQSNYIYGAAKGGLSIFLQGLRNRLHSSGVHVLTVKPGFVDTAMTYGKEGMFLVASPQQIGKSVVQALEKKKEIIYVPWFWRWIMLLIKAVPEKIFKKMRL